MGFSLLLLCLYLHAIDNGFAVHRSERNTLDDATVRTKERRRRKRKKSGSRLTLRIEAIYVFTSPRLTFIHSILERPRCERRTQQPLKQNISFDDVKRILKNEFIILNNGDNLTENAFVSRFACVCVCGKRWWVSRRLTFWLFDSRDRDQKWSEWVRLNYNTTHFRWTAFRILSILCSRRFLLFFFISSSRALIRIRHCRAEQSHVGLFLVSVRDPKAKTHLKLRNFFHFNFHWRDFFRCLRRRSRSSAPEYAYADECVGDVARYSCAQRTPIHAIKFNNHFKILCTFRFIAKHKDFEIVLF